MEIKYYNKLIRDNIPEIIEKQGKKAVITTLSETEYARELKLKLSEEVDEYLISGETEELADILEVVYALSELNGVSKHSLEDIRLRKRQSNGGFEKAIYLESVITD